MRDSFRQNLACGANMQYSGDHSDAYEESTELTTVEGDMKDGDLPLLPADAWVLIVEHLALPDVASCLATCTAWRRVLASNKIWKRLCQLCGVPMPPEKPPTSLYEHFRANAPSVLGPTLRFRHKPLQATVETLPESVAQAIEDMMVRDGRRLTMTLVQETFVLLNDELGLVSIELHHPYRIKQCFFEMSSIDGPNGAIPVPQRRSWTDGTHCIVQAPFQAKSKPMPVLVFRILLKKAELSIAFIGDTELISNNTFPYLMSCFFGKSFFLFEYHNALLSQGAIYRINLHDLKVANSYIFLGGGLTGGQPVSLSTMPSSGFSFGKFFILRKFLDAKVETNREILFILDQNLKVLQELTCGHDERWKYPFFRALSRDFVVIDSHHSHAPWSRAYKTGGAVLLKRLQIQKESMFIGGGLVDSHGLVSADVSKKNRNGYLLQIHFFPYEGKKKSFALDSFDVEIERKCITLLYGTNGLVVYFLSGLGTPNGAFKPKIQLLRFGGTELSTRRKKLTLPFKASSDSSGTDVLQKELMSLSQEMGVDELMRLVAFAKNQNNRNS